MVKIINTRPADRNQELSRLLAQAGFEPVEIPCVEIRADEEGAVKAASLAPNGFTGIFLSSPNGLKHFQEALLASQFEKWAEKPFYLVGGAARSLVEAAGGRVAFFPEEASLEGFLKEYRPFTEAGRLPMAQRWIHPCSRSTRLDPSEFKKKGIDIVNLAIYRPAAPGDLGDRLRNFGMGAAAVLFCSGSAVENFFQAAPDLAAGLGKPDGPLAVSIGPSTTRVLRDRGVAETREALHADDASLVDVLKAASGGAKTAVLKKTIPEPKP